MMKYDTVTVVEGAKVRGLVSPAAMALKSQRAFSSKGCTFEGFMQMLAERLSIPRQSIEGLYGPLGEPVHNMQVLRQFRKVIYLRVPRTAARTRSPRSTPTHNAGYPPRRGSVTGSPISERSSLQSFSGTPQRRMAPPLSAVPPRRSVMGGGGMGGGGVSPGERSLLSNNSTLFSVGAVPKVAHVARGRGVRTSSPDRKKVGRKRTNSLESIHHRFQREMSRGRTRSPEAQPRRSRSNESVSRMAVVPPPPKHLVGGVPSPRENGDIMLQNTFAYERNDSRRSTSASSRSHSASLTPPVNVPPLTNTSAVSPPRLGNSSVGSPHSPTIQIKPAPKRANRLSVNESVVPLFESHRTRNEIDDGLASGDLVTGIMRTGPTWDKCVYIDVDDAEDGLVVSTDCTRCALMISDTTSGDKTFPNRNRALPGDIVIVRTDFREVNVSMAADMHWDEELAGHGVVLGSVVSVKKRSEENSIFATITEDAVEAANAADLYAVATPLNPAYPRFLFPSVAVGLFLGTNTLEGKQAVVELRIRKEWPPTLRYPISDLSTIVSVLPSASAPGGMLSAGECPSVATPATCPISPTSPTTTPMFSLISPPQPNLAGFKVPRDASGESSAYYLEETLLLRELGVLRIDKETNVDNTFGSYIEGETPYMRDKLSGADLEEALEHMNWMKGVLTQGQVDEAVEDMRESVRVFLLATASNENDVVSGEAMDFDTTPQQVAYSCEKLRQGSASPDSTRSGGSVSPERTQTYRVGVHILDLGELIAETGPLEQLLKRRLSTVRLPHAVFPMLPSRVRTEACFRPGEAAPCLSIMWTATVERGQAPTISDPWIGATVVHVRCSLRDNHLGMLAGGCAHFPCPIFGINEQDNPITLRSDVISFMSIMNDFKTHERDVSSRSKDFTFYQIRGLFTSSQNGVHAPGAASPQRNAGKSERDSTQGRGPRVGQRSNFSSLMEKSFDPARDLYRIACGHDAMESLASSCACEHPVIFQIRRTAEKLANSLAAEQEEFQSLPSLIPTCKTASPAHIFASCRVNAHIYANKVPQSYTTPGLLSPYLRSWKVRENETQRFNLTQPMDSYVNMVILRMMRRVMKTKHEDLCTRTQRSEDHNKLRRSHLSNEDLNDSVRSAEAIMRDSLGTNSPMYYHSPVREAGIGRWKPSALKKLFSLDAERTTRQVAAYERLMDVTKEECLLQAQGTFLRTVGEYMGLKGEGDNQEIAVHIKEWGMLKWIPFKTKGM